MGISGCHLVGSRRVVGGKDNEEGDVVICVDWEMGWGN